MICSGCLRVASHTTCAVELSRIGGDQADYGVGIEDGMLHQHTKMARWLCVVMIQVRTKLGSAIFGRGPVANVATLRLGRFSGTGVIIKWVFVLFSVPFVICLFC